MSIPPRMKPIELWGHWGAPNPCQTDTFGRARKVYTIIEELDLPCNIHILELSEVKDESYTKLNPNGRLPTIVDPNTGITIWESAAIILYLIDQYDPQGKLSYKSFPEKHLTQQWLMFQISGQAPYFGQGTWFARFHSERIQSAIDRYVNEIERVVGVLDKALTGREWLVGDKCTYADISFVTWSHIGEGLLKEVGKAGVLENYPNYRRWLTTLDERSVIQGINRKIVEGRKAHGLP